MDALYYLFMCDEAMRGPRYRKCGITYLSRPCRFQAGRAADDLVFRLESFLPAFSEIIGKNKMLCSLI